MLTVDSSFPLARSGRRTGAGQRLLRPVEFGLAQTVYALDAAFRLVHDRYVWRGFMAPHFSGRRIGLHHALPTTKVFVATAGPQVVGTATLVEDSSAGLPMDEIYRDELDRFRAKGQRLGEASALATLATDARWRAAGLALLLRIMGLLVIWAAEFAALDLLCITVNPRHVEFYRRVLTFAVFGERKSYAKVNGAPAIALQLDLDRVRKVGAMEREGERARDEVWGSLLGEMDYHEVAAHLEAQTCVASAAAASFHGNDLGERAGRTPMAAGLAG